MKQKSLIRKYITHLCLFHCFVTYDFSYSNKWTRDSSVGRAVDCRRPTIYGNKRM